MRVCARVCAPARERARIEMYPPCNRVRFVYCIVLYYYYILKNLYLSIKANCAQFSYQNPLDACILVKV